MMNHLLAMSSLALWLPLAVQQDPAGRAAVPDSAAVKDAEKLVKDLFKEEYGRRSPADRVALAKRLLEQAAGAKDDPASQYVLLKEAMTLASQGGDLGVALKAIEDLGRGFQVNSVELKNDALSAAAKGARVPGDFGQLASAYLKLADEALQKDDFGAADKAASTASTHAKRAQNIVLLNRSLSKRKEVSEWKTRFDRLRRSRQVLASDPSDAAANADVGAYECFIKGNWPVGLPLLAKGAEGPARDAAVRDLSGPRTPQEQAAAGDAWWDVAEKLEDPSRTIVRGRARYWYELTDGKLAGLSQVKTEKRLLEARMEWVHQGVWTDVSDPKHYKRSGPGVTLAPKEKAILSSLPAGEFDGVSVRIKITPGPRTTRVAIEYDKDTFCFFVYQESNEVMNSRLEGTVWMGFQRMTYPSKEEYTLTVLLADGQYVGYADGREVFRHSTPRESLTPFELWVAAGANNVNFDQIRLRKRQ